MRDDLDLTVFKEFLEMRLTLLLAEREAQQKVAAPVELDQASVGRLSRMDGMQQQAMAQAATRRIELETQRIRTAIDRIDANNYGYCVKCEEEIALARLRADPAALLCIDCARNAEAS